MQRFNGCHIFMDQFEFYKIKIQIKSRRPWLTWNLFWLNFSLHTIFSFYEHLPHIEPQLLLFFLRLTFKTLMCKYFYIHNNMDHGNWHLWDDRSINPS